MVPQTDLNMILVIIKAPNNRVLGPKYFEDYRLWALKPYYLGLWTLI